MVLIHEDEESKGARVLLRGVLEPPITCGLREVFECRPSKQGRGLLFFFLSLLLLIFFLLLLLVFGSVPFFFFSLFFLSVLLFLLFSLLFWSFIPSRLFFVSLLFLFFFFFQFGYLILSYSLFFLRLSTCSYLNLSEFISSFLCSSPVLTSKQLRKL